MSLVSASPTWHVASLGTPAPSSWWSDCLAETLTARCLYAELTHPLAGSQACMEWHIGRCEHSVSRQLVTQRWRWPDSVATLCLQSGAFLSLLHPAAGDIPQERLLSLSPSSSFLGKLSTLSAFLCKVQSLLLETGRVSEAKYGVQPEFAYANIHIFMQMHMHTMPCRCSWSAMSSERHWNLVFSGYYSNGWTMTKCLKPVQELQQVCPSLSTMSVHMHATARIWRSQYDFHETVLSFQFVYEAGYLLFLLSCVLRAR